jgi:hypothetical protein
MYARREPAFALSVDDEDYFQVQAFAGRVAREDWPHFPPRVEENVARLLDLFDESGSKAPIATRLSELGILDAPSGNGAP